ncbi:MAG: TlpA family protein disulfide reductase [Gammaproteobacteria bacterium]|nr:TlpA family protein disulfide reductase [Gammaproteobacteria bacterium]
MAAPVRWLLILLLALGAGATAYLLSRAWLAPEPALITLPAAPTAPKPVIPERRPDVALADRDGKLRQLSEWDGRPQIINFWATWCAPCRREIPMLNEIARDPALAEFALIGIAVDFREDVLSFLGTTPIEYTVLIGEQDGLDAARAFGVESLGLPFTVFVDRAGRIVTLHVGELHRSQADVILSAVRALDAGRIDLQAAREQIRTQAPKIG